MPPACLIAQDGNAQIFYALSINFCCKITPIFSPIVLAKPALVLVSLSWHTFCRHFSVILHQTDYNRIKPVFNEKNETF